MKSRKCKRRYGLYIVRLLNTGRFLLLVSLFTFALLYGFSSAALSSAADKDKFAEYKVKAAYLYNFAKFVEWPSEQFANPSTPFGICIMGKDPFGSAIDSIKDKLVKGKKLEIRQYAGKSELSGCHIIFISDSEKNNLTGILKMINGSHILTVSDINKFAKNGGMINLKQVKDKIRLEINNEAAKDSGLKVSSKLLKIAKIVKGKK